jgi:CheY-like chemotaxis protein
VFRLALPIATRALALEASPPESSVAQLAQARVLVIEDDVDVLQGMLHLLHDWGCVSEGAADIDEALDLAQRLVPQLVISDYRLREGRTGAQAIAAVRALMGADLPALLITGDTAPERLREAMASGVTLLHKPLSPGRLLSEMVTALRL